MSVLMKVLLVSALVPVVGGCAPRPHAPAPDLIIRGRVADALTRRPLLSQISIMRNTTMTSASTGEFELRVPRTGNEILIAIRRIGYTAKDTVIALSNALEYNLGTVLLAVGPLQVDDLIVQDTSRRSRRP